MNKRSNRENSRKSRNSRNSRNTKQGSNSRNNSSRQNSGSRVKQTPAYKKLMKLLKKNMKGKKTTFENK